MSITNRIKLDKYKVLMIITVALISAFTANKFDNYLVGIFGIIMFYLGIVVHEVQYQEKENFFNNNEEK